MHLAGSDGLYRFIVFDLDAKTDEARERCRRRRRRRRRSAHRGGDPVRRVPIVGLGRVPRVVALREAIPVAMMRELTAAAGAALTTLDYGMLHNAATGACRPPGAPHRDGSVSTIIRGELSALTEPTAAAVDVAALTAASAPVSPRSALSAPSRPGGRPGISARTGSSHGGVSCRWPLSPAATTPPAPATCACSRPLRPVELRDVEHASHTAPGMEHYRTKNTAAHPPPP